MKKYKYVLEYEFEAESEDNAWEQLGESLVDDPVNQTDFTLEVDD